MKPATPAAAEGFLAVDTRSDFGAPVTRPTAPGSGAVTCACGNHRERCSFGRRHTWADWYHQAELVRTEDTYSCWNCGAVCTTEESTA